MKEKKKIPKPVLFWLLLVGFLAGNAIGGLMLMFNLILAWAIINALSILTFFLLDWRFGEILQEYIPRYKKQENGESQ